MMASRSSFDEPKQQQSKSFNGPPRPNQDTRNRHWPALLLLNSHHLQKASPQHNTSPLHKSHHSPITPSPSKARPMQVQSASPRCIRQDRTSISSNTPSVTAYYNYSDNGVTRHQQATVPNYMAATESARARVRSQSAPRQRPATPEQDRTGSVKKRLSFPVPDPYYSQNLRSPSFKSVAARFEQMSNVSSCCGGEISPSSTTDLRRWLR